MRVVILKSFCQYRKGNVYNMENAIASSLIRKGLARKEYKQMTDKKYSATKKALEDLREFERSTDRGKLLEYILMNTLSMDPIKDKPNG